MDAPGTPPLSAGAEMSYLVHIQSLDFARVRAALLIQHLPDLSGAAIAWITMTPILRVMTCRHSAS